MQRKWCSILLVVALLLVFPVTASAEAVFAGGSGTAEDPWQISTAGQMDHVRDDLTAHYVLINDIDLSEFENWKPLERFSRGLTPRKMLRSRIRTMLLPAPLTDKAIRFPI